MTERTFGFSTQQLHAGQSPDPATGARAVPIYQTTSFVFKDFAAAKAISSVEEFGFDYSRITNPTNEVLENRIAALEGGSGALSLASGSAATGRSTSRQPVPRTTPAPWTSPGRRTAGASASRPSTPASGRGPTRSTTPT